MSTDGRFAFGLRPMLPQDAPALAEIFRVSIEDLTDDDYSPAQQEAWAAIADDEDAFAQRLSQRVTLVALHDGEPVGFGSLEDNSKIDMLYVHPGAAGQGAGLMLYNALEKIAASRGAANLAVDASDTARDFFAHRGFTAEQRQTVAVGDEWLANTRMKKKLKGAAA